MNKNIMTYVSKVRNKLVAIPVASSGLLLSSATFAAVDPAVTGAVDAAYTDGGTLVTLAVASLIGLVAIGVGVSMLISMLRKG